MLYIYQTQKQNVQLKRNKLVKKLAYIIYKIIFFIDILLKKITKRSILVWFKEFIENDSYIIFNVLNKNINFFAPNQIIQWRVETFLTKEPETLEWIDGFHNKKKIIFWDIGANIGLYSIYAALKHKDIEIVSFEPSTSNLRILSRNISINKFEDKIFIYPSPLTKIENQRLIFEESDFFEGSSNNTFGEGIDFTGKLLKPKNRYKIFGTNINHLIKNNYLSTPNYIKIDVDGIEHLILQGASNCLNSPEIKSISIELNEDFKEQFNTVLRIMDESNFRFKHKKQGSLYDYSHKFSKVYNYVFEK
jgi:FkbM family methyltransferase